MSDAIDRQAAIDEIKDMYHAAEKWGKEASDDVIKARAESCMASLIEMKLRVEKLPFVQPEIIRCKDCKNQEKFFQKDGRRKDGGYYIYGCSLAEEYSHVCLDDDYCSRAERRTDEK